MDIFDVIKGAYVSKIVWNFHENGIFSQMKLPITAKELAKNNSFDESLLIQLLDFLCFTTNITKKITIMYQEDKYILNPQYKSYDNFGHHLDKLLGCYGPALDQLDKTLKSPSLGRDFVNEDKLMVAFNTKPYKSLFLLELISKHCPPPIVLCDLGCGPGTLVFNVAKTIPQSRCFGIDFSEPMCQAAKEKIQKGDLGNVVKIVKGDVKDVATLLSTEELGSINVLFGGSILNEMFRFGVKEVIDFLKLLHKIFPDETKFIVTDYYGKLGYVNNIDKDHLHNLLHDVCQAVSGQGIPVDNYEKWSNIYKEGGWKVLSTFETSSGGIDGFVHLLKKI